MTKNRTIILISLAALVVSLALIAQAKEAKDGQLHQQQQPTQSTSLASKLLPHTKARTSRSLSDMFEKVRSKIFGSRKQQASATSSSSSTTSQIQPAASVNVAQRQPWGDFNSFNQQYSPYSALGASNYQWPTANSAVNQFSSQQYNPMSGYINSQTGSPASYPSLMGAQSQQTLGASGMMSGLEGQQQQQSQQSASSSLNPAVNSNGASNGGLLSSASHLIAQYLSPSSASSSSSSSSAGSQQQGVSSSVAGQQGQQSSQQAQQNLLSPQQQQQQSQYNEFASILDSMVAQTGTSQQRQPSMSQYLGAGSVGAQGLQTPQQGAQQAASTFQGSAGNMMGSGASMVGDTEMSGSSNVQSYLPAASAQQASQKSSMVGLAEQLAPGAQFNKLVSFPFSLSNNDDPSKEGRYKLHIPFLNQHVKRSDQQQQQQQVAVSNQQQQMRQQQQQQQYLNSYYAQQQYAMANPQQQQQNPQQQQGLIAQSSQVVPTVISPQSSANVAQQQTPGSSSSALAPSSILSSASVSQSAQNSPASAVQNPSASVLSSSNSPSVSSSVLTGQQASGSGRPAWSVADLQTSASSSKLIPMPSSASVDSAASQN